MRYERFGVGVRRCQVLLNGGNQLGDASKLPRRTRFSLPEPPLHQVQPRELVGMKWRANRACLSSHARTLGSCGSRSCPGPDGGALPETPGPAAAGSVRLLVTVPGHALPDHASIQEIKGRKQGGGPVPLIVVGHRPTTSLFHGQAGLYAGAPGFGSSRPRIAPQLCRED